MQHIIKKGFNLVLILLIMFVIFPYAAAKQKERDDEAKLTSAARLTIFKARTAISEDKLDEARVILEKYIASGPQVVPIQVYELVAYIWMEKGDLEQAKKYFGIMHRAKPGDTKILKNYASLTYQTEQYGEAAVLFEQLYEIEEITKPGGSLPNAAQAYMLANDLDNSKRILVKLVGLPGKPEAQWYKVLVGICMEREEMRDAERYILDFLRLDPVQAQYWKYLAQIRMGREEWQEATSDLEISHRVEAPKRSSEWVILGDLYTSAVNAPLMGARCYKEAYKDSGDEKGYLSISRNYQAAYRYDEALKILDEGIRENSRSATLFFEKGRVLYEARRYMEAIAALKKCVEIDTESGDAYFQMGLAAWTVKDWDTARTAFVQAKRLSERYTSQCNSVIALLDDLREENAEVNEIK
jgi:tetratricopeptide (TPR) repeat protein